MGREMLGIDTLAKTMSKVNTAVAGIEQICEARHRNILDTEGLLVLNCSHITWDMGDYSG